MDLILRNKSSSRLMALKEGSDVSCHYPVRRQLFVLGYFLHSSKHRYKVSKYLCKIINFRGTNSGYIVFNVQTDTKYYPEERACNVNIRIFVLVCQDEIKE